MRKYATLISRVKQLHNIKAAQTCKRPDHETVLAARSSVWTVGRWHCPTGPPSATEGVAQPEAETHGQDDATSPVPRHVALHCGDHLHHLVDELLNVGVLDP